LDLARGIDEGNETAAAGEQLAAATLCVRLTRPILRELRLRLLEYASPFGVELELVEQRFDNGDVVVRLARPDRPEWDQVILGAYNVREPEDDDEAISL
jgi:hypothetical protein